MLMSYAPGPWRQKSKAAFLELCRWCGREVPTFGLSCDCAVAGRSHTSVPFATAVPWSLNLDGAEPGGASESSLVCLPGAARGVLTLTLGAIGHVVGRTG